MKYQAKVAGKKQEWKEFEPEGLKDWSFEKRAGGWVIATRVAASDEASKVLYPVGARVRFHYQKIKNQFWAKVNGSDFFGEKVPITRAGAKDAESDFTAQFPGKVRKIMVKPDQAVEAGTPLLMIEAMKMEFAIKATSAGTVKAVLVTEGQVLTPGEKLLEFEVKA